MDPAPGRLYHSGRPSPKTTHILKTASGSPTEAHVRLGVEYNPLPGTHKKREICAGLCQVLLRAITKYWSSKKLIKAAKVPVTGGVEVTRHGRPQTNPERTDMLLRGHEDHHQPGTRVSHCRYATSQNRWLHSVSPVDPAAEPQVRPPSSSPGVILGARSRHCPAHQVAHWLRALPGKSSFLATAGHLATSRLQAGPWRLEGAGKSHLLSELVIF